MGASGVNQAAQRTLGAAALDGTVDTLRAGFRSGVTRAAI